MRKIFSIISIFYSLSFTLLAVGDEARFNQLTSSTSRSETAAKINSMSHEIEIIKRDQVNYKTEKDLLKELYSTEIQNVNLFLSTVLAATAIFGFFGLKSISEIKKEYRDELEKLIALKSKLQGEIDDLQKKQSSFDLKIDEITKKNEKQDTRLRVMEIIEKAGALISQSNYTWALHWANAGLESEPENMILLSQKAVCHFFLGEYSASEETYIKMSKIEPDQVIHKINLVELYALMGKSIDFRETFNAISDDINSRNDGRLRYFLEATNYAMSGNQPEASNSLNAYVEKYREAGTKMARWSYKEAKEFQQRMSRGSQKEMLAYVVGVFSGEMDPDFAISGAREIVAASHS